MSETDPPSSKTVDYARLRRRFGLAFLISTGLFVVFTLCALGVTSLNIRAPSPTRAPSGTQSLLPTLQPGTAAPTQEPPPTRTPLPAMSPAGPSDPWDTFTLAAGIVGIAGTCLTSATTLGGFMITTVLSLRQERRHARVSELESQLQEVELEKQKLELERMRQAQRNRGENQD